MSTLYTTATIEISLDNTPDAKTLHLLRRRLDEVLQEAADGVLAEFDIENQLVHTLSVDEIEIDDGGDE